MLGISSNKLRSSQYTEDLGNTRLYILQFSQRKPSPLGKKRCSEATFQRISALVILAVLSCPGIRPVSTNPQDASYIECSKFLCNGFGHFRGYISYILYISRRRRSKLHSFGSDQLHPYICIQSMILLRVYRTPWTLSIDYLCGTAPHYLYEVRPDRMTLSEYLHMQLSNCRRSTPFKEK